MNDIIHIVSGVLVVCAAFFGVLCLFEVWRERRALRMVAERKLYEGKPVWPWPQGPMS